MDTNTARLMTAARAMCEATSALDPDAGHHDIVETASNIQAAETRLLGVIADVYDARRPETLADVPPWLVHHPDPGVGSLRPWWGRIGDGPGAFVTDGHAMLIVEHAPDAPIEAEWGYRQDLNDAAWAEKKIGTIWPKQGDRWGVLCGLPEDPVVRYVFIGPAWVDLVYLRTWIDVARSLSGQAEVFVNGALGPVEFRGDGWRALVMPRALDRGRDEEREATVRLMPVPMATKGDGTLFGGA